MKNNGIIYLDNAATSFPKPPECIREYEKCIVEYSANAGRGAHRMSIKAAEKVYETREQLCNLFGGDNPERFIFTGNTTMALNIGLKGYLKRGHEVIISSMEHNSVLRAVTSLADKGVSVKIVTADKNGYVSSEDILKEVTPKTALVCLTHVSNVTGSINDIEKTGKLLKNRKIMFMVDAAQSAGTVPIDIKKFKIDLLAFPGHKGLLGPMGTGGLYVGEGIEIDTIIEGGTGSISESRYQPGFLPDRLESGTLNLPGIAGLSGGLYYISKRGVEEIGYHEKKMGERLCEKVGNIKGVKVLGGGNKTGVVSIIHEKYEPSYIAERLDREYGIAVRSGLHCSPFAAKTLGTEKGGTLRFSPGAFTTSRETDIAALALKRILE